MIPVKSDDCCRCFLGLTYGNRHLKCTVPPPLTVRGDSEGAYSGRDEERHAVKISQPGMLAPWLVQRSSFNILSRTRRRNAWAQICARYKHATREEESNRL